MSTKPPTRIWFASLFFQLVSGRSSAFHSRPLALHPAASRLQHHCLHVFRARHVAPFQPLVHMKFLRCEPFSLNLQFLSDSYNKFCEKKKMLTGKQWKKPSKSIGIFPYLMWENWFSTIFREDLKATNEGKNANCHDLPTNNSAVRAGAEGGTWHTKVAWQDLASTFVPFPCNTSYSKWWLRHDKCA